MSPNGFHARLALHQLHLSTLRAKRADVQTTNKELRTPLRLAASPSSFLDSLLSPPPNVSLPFHSNPSQGRAWRRVQQGACRRGICTCAAHARGGGRAVVLAVEHASDVRRGARRGNLPRVAVQRELGAEGHATAVCTRDSASVALSGAPPPK